MFRRGRVACLKSLMVLGSGFFVILLLKNLIFLPATDDISTLQYVEEEENDIGNSLEEDTHVGLEKISKHIWPDPPVPRVEKKLKLSIKPEVSRTAQDKVVRTSAISEDKPVGVAEMSATIKKLNSEQTILNLEKFPTRSQESIVIVVQVHKRANYLRKLIRSLENARGISDALLIISHDYFSDEINKIVKNIDFCQVIQIFFPYSAQLHPNKFPGTDPNDCPRDKVVPGCNNADHPDMYGHFREAKFTMTKHHWWWKANRVLQHLRATSKHQGLFLFLEEDHYLAPDFYEVLQKAYTMKASSQECKEMGCDIITLGNYRQVFSYEGDWSNTLEIMPWRSTDHNMGMAFDRQTWEMIHKCRNIFCTYDDYNWDWTLMKMSVTCFDRPLNVLLVKQARVFHIGTCGLHHKNGNCDIEQVIGEVRTVISNGKQFLYPKKLIINIAQPWIKRSPGQPNGGWGDTRDHALCLQFTMTTE